MDHLDSKDGTYPDESLRLRRASERETHFLRAICDPLPEGDSTVCIQHSRWSGGIDIYTWNGSVYDSIENATSGPYSEATDLQDLLTSLGAVTFEGEWADYGASATGNVGRQSVDDIQLRNLYRTCRIYREGPPCEVEWRDTPWASTRRNHHSTFCPPLCPGIPRDTPSLDHLEPINRKQGDCVPPPPSGSRASIHFGEVQDDIRGYVPSWKSESWRGWREGLADQLKEQVPREIRGRPRNRGAVTVHFFEKVY